MNIAKLTICRCLMAAFLTLLAFQASPATPIDNARQLFEDGEYQAALTRLEPMLSKPATAKNPEVNFLAGACCIALGDNARGTKLLDNAIRRGSLDATIFMAEESINRYRLEEAEGYIEAYESAIAKKKKAPREGLDELNSRIVLTRNMLDRVEKIAVIDSITVPRDDFFRYYRLSPETGRLADASILPRSIRTSSPGVVYVPQNEVSLLWAATDTTGTSVLMGADLLGDGTMSQPHMLDGDFNDNGDANFPFMMSDGITLYYANDGDNTLGGYDIFMTRKGDDGKFLQPQNIGMPYNSPYDDYMLAIDEVTGAGWWATDRNQIPDSVTIYVFVPNDVRQNYTADDPDVASLAMIESISRTQTSPEGYDDVRRRISETASAGNADSENSFRFYIPGKGIYTAMEDFRSAEAARAMQKYIDKRNEISRQRRHLTLLRKEYAEGNMDVSTEIARLEHSLLSADTELDKAASAVVKAEL